MSAWKQKRIEASAGDTQRWLKQALLLSCLLNILCLFAFVYSYCVPHGQPGRLELGFYPTCDADCACANPRSSVAVYQAMRALSTKKLFNRLNDRRAVEAGLDQRDLALAVLVNEKHFDLKRALGVLPPITRQMALCKDVSESTETVTVYPKLTDRHYRKIQRFVEKESWPFTNEGLFALLQQSAIESVPAMRRAFYATPEFQALERVLRASGAELRRMDELHMVLDGTWALLAAVYEQQRLVKDLSDQARRAIFLAYIDAGASTAARLLLTTDFDWAVSTLEDGQALTVLELLPGSCLELEPFALTMLTSPRKPEVWHSSAKRLYEIADEEAPLVFDHLEALQHFAPEMAISCSATLLEDLENRSIDGGFQEAEIACQSCVHQVVRGESLWRIANRYGVSVESLQGINHLAGDEIHVGDILWIPREPQVLDQNRLDAKGRSAEVAIE